MTSNGLSPLSTGANLALLAGRGVDCVFSLPDKIAEGSFLGNVYAVAGIDLKVHFTV